MTLFDLEEALAQATRAAEYSERYRVSVALHKAKAQAQALRARQEVEDVLVPGVPAANGWFRHKYGGLYQFLAVYVSPTDEVMAVYRHAWPFEPKLYERPLSEFAERFEPISEHAAEKDMAGDRTAAQARVAQAKTAGQAVGNPRTT